MDDEMRPLTSRDTELISLTSGLKCRKHARSPEIDLAEYFYEAGVASAEGPHSHMFSTAVFITGGVFELKYYKESTTFTLQAGDSYVALAGQEHTITCIQDGSYLVAKPVGRLAAGSHDERFAQEGHSHGHAG
jgi:hypothetical protein